MNPVLHTLGFSPSDRVAIVHADDIGAYQASVPAIEDLFAAGLVSSCATMVPCPWFPAVAAWARRTPEADIGVHVTLTSEYATMRWGPISTRDRESGLLDDDGYLHRTSADAQAHGDLNAVAVEHEAQIDRALAAGIDVTHIDSHMLASFSATFLSGYLAAARAARVPAMVPRIDADTELGRAYVGSWAEAWRSTTGQLEADGLPLIDNIVMMPLDRHADRVGEAKALFAALPPGLSYVILHPAMDTPEIRAATPGDWQSRVGDYAAFADPELLRSVRDQGIQVIGWRAIRDALRESAL